MYCIKKGNKIIDPILFDIHRVVNQMYLTATYY